MKPSKNNQRVKYIPPYESRKKWPRAIRDTLKEIRLCRRRGDWKQASWLEHTIRNAWWGYSKYI